MHFFPELSKPNPIRTGGVTEKHFPEPAFVQRRAQLRAHAILRAQKRDQGKVFGSNIVEPHVGDEYGPETSKVHFEKPEPASFDEEKKKQKAINKFPRVHCEEDDA